MVGRVLALVTALAAGASAFKLTFQNNCEFTVWPAVGLAPSGHPDNRFSWGMRADPGQSVSVEVDDSFLGVRAWGRTGCNDNGSNCKTGGCNGGLVCTDAGITSGVIVSEFGYADFGERWGGKRTSWDLSYVDLKINLDTKLVASDGQSVLCPTSGCADDQAYRYSTDYAADRNSDPGTAYTHIFCPNGSAKPAPKPDPKPTPKPAPSQPSKPTRPIPEPTPNTPPADTPATTPGSSAALVPTSGGRCSKKSARRLRSLERRQIS
ncbi:Osmotin, thaumatin-like protein [Auricularia subglabra TFB-10046 SS5]|nr:Osmotin, thaumatin-like protein [Auricularia subglabra TFB-10046 SS5]